LFLDISNNNIGTSWYLNSAYAADPHGEYKYKNTAGGEQDAEPAGGLGPIGVVAVANAIKDIGALTSLDISDNSIPSYLLQQMMQKVACNKLMPLLADNTLTELDLSGIGFGSEGSVAVAKYISGNGAISSVNLLRNGIDVHQAEALVSILKEHLTLKSICGNTGNKTELDMRGKMNGAGDAIMLVQEIIYNGAGVLTSLNLASNDIGGYEDEEGNVIATPEGITTLYCAYPTY
jgi:hypothetical protein